MKKGDFIILFAALLAGGSLAAYGSQSLTGDEGASGKRKLSPFPHAVHIENELECTDCHDGAVEKKKAGLPDGETCFDCHDDPESESPAAKAFFSERSEGEHKLFFRSSYDFKDLKFSHKDHMARGAQCMDCHGDVGKGEIIRKGNPDFKHTCLDCHTLMKASVECKTCHYTYRKDKAPKDHEGPGFLKSHSQKVKPYFRALPEDRCFYCHEVGSCDRCHKENRPDSHDAPLFLRHHGDRVRMAQQTLDQSACAVCHDGSGCQACHRRMEPRSHTVSFKNRNHGLVSRLDRNACRPCHDQTFCVNCHTSVKPISHKGAFDTGSQYHCYNCHIPVQGTRCGVCHRSTPGHQSLPRPVDPTHQGAAANACRVCHTPGPHADNGTNCTVCH